MQNCFTNCHQSSRKNTDFKCTKNFLNGLKVTLIFLNIVIKATNNEFMDMTRQQRHNHLSGRFHTIEKSASKSVERLDNVVDFYQFSGYCLMGIFF